MAASLAKVMTRQNRPSGLSNSTLLNTKSVIIVTMFENQDLKDQRSRMLVRI